MISENDYAPLKTRAFLAAGFIALQALLVLGMLFSIFAYFISPETMYRDQSLWLVAHDLLSSVRALLYLVGVVFFLVWLHRANKNLLALKPDHLEYTAGWAVGWWFVPFANLVKPFQVVREVWCESDSELSEGPSFLTSSLHTAPSYMGFWWAAFLLMGFLGNLTRFFGSSQAQNDLYMRLYVLAAFDGMIIVACLLVLYLILDVSSRQNQRVTKLEPMLLSTSPPPPIFNEIG